MSDEFSYTIKLKRGAGNDVQKCSVTAPDIQTLERRVDEVRQRLQKWAGDYREIQPEDRRSRRVTDDQTGLDEVEA